MEFCMKVPVFGNSPSPAIAICGLRRAAKLGKEEYGSNTKQFVFHNFYVDDGLASVDSEREAIKLLTQARNMMAELNIRLHKIASNVSHVMNAFPPEERAADLKDLELDVDPLPLQQTLGDNKPFTRRGILSVVNSLYDPFGFAAPVTIQGKALYRKLTVGQQDWDEPLPADREAEWLRWSESLTALEHLQIHRPFVELSASEAQRRELSIFSDASTTVIAAVAYLRAIDTGHQCHVGFIMGKSKLAPSSAHTIPCLELCAAVLAVELSQVIIDESDIEFHAVNFYTDS
ncbi:hypothetical protein CCH79_00009291 [Gambusia affinis]|uniref:Uncharacterized protein n=1 Tax=Gambusia affinis TaxID=33528 RepID=A0A315W6W7_GAMAF|nr:hypothetical protein CCH79_00009291 [Gambusia affinis]